MLAITTELPAGTARRKVMQEKNKVLFESARRVCHIGKEHEICRTRIPVQHNRAKIGEQ